MCRGKGLIPVPYSCAVNGNIKGYSFLWRWIEGNLSRVVVSGIFFIKQEEEEKKSGSGGHVFIWH